MDIQKRIQKLETEEKNLIQTIGIGEKQLAQARTTLISVRGGLIELRSLIKEEIKEKETEEEE